MELVPVSVGRVSAQWDEQSLDLTAASQKTAGAGVDGFSSAVRGSASRFLRTWERHTDLAATRCEAQADGLRDTIQEFLATDGAVSADFVRLADYLTERR